MVGVSGFEPEASWTRTKRDTKLRHTPIDQNIIMRFLLLVKPRLVFYPVFSCKMNRGDWMAYRIDYAPATPVRKTGPGKILHWQMMTAVFLLIFTFLVSQTWPEGTQKLRAYLLPGDGTAEAAFQEFVTGVNAGEPVGEALTAFCRQIIENGQAG